MYVGMEIGRDVLRGAVVEHPARPPVRVAEVRLAAESEADPLAAVRQALPRLLEELRSPGAACALAVPSEWCFFRRVCFPFRGQTRIERTLPFALENRLPGRIEDYVIEPLTEALDAGRRGAWTFVAACPIPRLRAVLDAFRSAGADPRVVQPSVAAAAAAVRRVVAGSGVGLMVRVLADGVELAWFDSNAVLAAQRLFLADARPASVAEAAGAAVEAIRLSETPPDFREIILLAPKAEADAFAAALRSRLDRPARAIFPPTDGASWAAWGVAADAAVRRHYAPSLRRGEFVWPPYAVRLDKRIAAVLLLSAALAAAWGVHGLRRHAQAEKALRAVRQSQTELFREVVGEGRPYLRPMQARLKALASQAGAGGPPDVASCLDRWVALTRLVPDKAGLRLETVDIKPGGVALAGTAPAAAAVWSFREALASSEMFLPDPPTVTKDAAEGKVSFTMQLGFRR